MILCNYHQPHFACNFLQYQELHSLETLLFIINEIYSQHGSTIWLIQQLALRELDNFCVHQQQRNGAPILFAIASCESYTHIWKPSHDISNGGQLHTPKGEKRITCIPYDFFQKKMSLISDTHFSFTSFASKTFVTASCFTQLWLFFWFRAEASFLCLVLVEYNYLLTVCREKFI